MDLIESKSKSNGEEAGRTDEEEQECMQAGEQGQPGRGQGRHGSSTKQSNRAGGIAALARASTATFRRRPETIHSLIILFALLPLPSIYAFSFIKNKREEIGNCW